MAVRIRLTRYGKRNRPSFRIAVFDSRTRRDGRYLENLGLYDPIAKDDAKKVTIDAGRLQHWVAQGALPTPKLGKIFAHCGVALKPPSNAPAKPVKK
jgi:small subunit ribosomal protein S16